MRFLLLSLIALAAFSTYADDAKDIRDTLTAMWAALENGDVDAYSKFLHSDYTVFGEGDVYLAEGRALEIRSMKDWVGRSDNVHTEMHNPQVTVRGDTAWITYYWTDAGYSGKERFTSRGKSTRIFVRENNQWLCIHGHFTEVP